MFSIHAEHPLVNNEHVASVADANALNIHRWSTVVEFLKACVIVQSLVKNPVVPSHILISISSHGVDKKWYSCHLSQFGKTPRRDSIRWFCKQIYTDISNTYTHFILLCNLISQYDQIFGKHTFSYIGKAYKQYLLINGLSWMNRDVYIDGTIIKLSCYCAYIYSSPPGQNGRHFADDIFRCHFVNEKLCILIKISLKFVPKGPTDNYPALVQIMAWRRIGDTPLSEPILIRFTDSYMRC